MAQCVRLLRATAWHRALSDRYMRAFAIVATLAACGGSKQPAPIRTPPPQPSCTDHAYDMFDPAIDEASPVREWHRNARRTVISDEATTEWSVARLHPEVHARLIRLRDFATTMDALRKTPAQLECKNVAALYQTEELWRTTLAKTNPTERTAVIERARYTMASACKDEAWDDVTRACIIAGGDEELCFGTSTRHWDPKLVATRYPRECDEYRRIVRVFQACTKVSQKDRDAEDNWLDSVSAHWFELDGDALESLPLACKTGAEKAREKLAVAGC